MSVGASPVRFDAADKVTGRAAYPSDRIGPDALWGLTVFTDQPHARLVSVDFSAAEAVPGVVGVLGSADVPVNEFGLTMFDHPVLIGTTHTGRSTVACDVSRWEADRLALVIAETPEAARAGAAAIHAEWEQLPVLADIDEALASPVLLHPENDKPGNEYYSLRIRKGDMAKGWADADVVVESTYEFPYQEHVYLQPEAGQAWIDEQGRVTVEVAGQWTHHDREQIAHALDVPEEQVRVIYPAIGGAFGGREDISVQIVLALAAQWLHRRGIHRPVATIWSREESIVGHNKRHRGRITTRWGARRDGRLTAVESTAWLDAGAYNFTSNKVLGNCHLHQSGPYEIPNISIDSHAVYTNATPGGAFRGFGAPQGAYAAESQMNKLAAALGLDPVEMRRINALDDSSLGATQTPLPGGVTITKVIDRCALAAAAGPAPHGVTDEDPTEHHAEDHAEGHAEGFSPFVSLPPERAALRRGQGFACSFKNVGFSFGFPERCEATIVLHPSPDSDPESDSDPDGEPGADPEGDERPWRAELFHAGAEVGQGSHTVFAQMAAEATGVPAHRVDCTYSDTATSGDSGSASASRLTWMSGNSILGAAEEAEKAWRAGDRPAVGHFRFTPPPTESLDPVDGSGSPNFTYGYVAQWVDLVVDTETGHIAVLRVVSAHDVGKAINPDLLVGQIEGSVVQAHGYAISENLQSHQGRIVNSRLSTYLMPGIGDIPRQVDSVILEEADPLGPWGARGMAEMGMIPYAPAVVAALHDATGVWFDSFPLTPDRVMEGLLAAAPTADSPEGG